MATQRRRPTYYAADGQGHVYSFKNKKNRTDFCQFGNFRPVPDNAVRIELMQGGRNLLTKESIAS